ncbi:hypothetical protein BPOR_0626g00060 [Botrytis porri]|uniref:BTB domain-containing protein n=1 Tax=Botrytis porri TaxID=87229 RepID=A0A4Z1KBT9_9HELO|nr:hypothetical protein BPOR_0626g00060 [Botrytis porri]
MDPSKKKKSGTRTSFFKKAEIQMVEIRVGEELKLFRVHKSLLCTRVPYFDKILSKGFSESITNSAVLQEDNTEAFDVLVDWVYTNRLPPEIASGIRRYILADKICPPELMDQVMDRIRTEYPLGPPDVLDIYSRLPNGSKLRSCRYERKERGVCNRLSDQRPKLYMPSDVCFHASEEPSLRVSLSKR